MADGAMCPWCSKCVLEWQCQDCLGRPFLCRDCCRVSHLRLPFHRVDHWNRLHFQPGWLKDISLLIHLGHIGLPCCMNTEPNPFETGGDMDIEDWDDDDDMDSRPVVNIPIPLALVWQAGATWVRPQTVLCIVDSSGIHQLHVTWYRCLGHLLDDWQMLALNLFPATFKCIKTAFTFKVLDDFCINNLECKIAALNFYSKLKHLIFIWIVWRCDAWTMSVRAGHSQPLAVY